MLNRISSTFLIALALLLPAWAYDVTGTWISDSGSTIVIPRSRSSFTVLVTHQDGAQFRCAAAWVPGRVGTRFHFVNEYNHELFVSVDQNDPRHLRLNEGSKQWYWRRVGH